MLTFALMNENYRAIIDDAEARRCARTLGISTLGTGGLLVLAKRRGLISSLSETLDAMKNAGLWLSENLIEILKRQVDE